MAVLLVLVVTLGLGGALAGCGGDDGGGADSSDLGDTGAGDEASGDVDAPDVEAGPVDFEQAEVLGSTLFRNHELGGAHVEVVAPITEDLTLFAEGEVDFGAPTGHLVGEVRSGDQADPFEVYFTADQLYADATSIEAQGGGPYPDGTEWVARPPTRQLPLDVVIGLITGLAAEDRDNPALIQDDDTNQVVRGDVVGGEPVVVYDHGPTVQLWIDDEGLTRRAELEVTGFAHRVVIDLTDHGPVEVELPPESTVHVEVEAPSAEAG